MMLMSVSNKLSVYKKDLEQKTSLINISMDKFIDSKRWFLDKLVAKLEKSNPLHILKTGYAKVLKTGESVDIDKIKKGDELEIYLNGGVIESVVKDIRRN